MIWAPLALVVWGVHLGVVLACTPDPLRIAVDVLLILALLIVEVSAKRAAREVE